MTARRVIPWLALLAILVVALVVGTHGKSGRLTVDQRVHRVADELRCPTCRSQSMADSDAAAAKARLLELRQERPALAQCPLLAKILTHWKSWVGGGPDPDGHPDNFWCV